jgi:hypothetical protein
MGADDPTADVEARRRAEVRRKKQREVLPPLSVPRIDASELNDESFFMEYVLSNRPVIIRGAIDHWPAMHKWSRAYFEEKFGKEPIKASPLPPSGANVWFDKTTDWRPEGVEELPGVRNPEKLLVVSGVREAMSFGDLLQALTPLPGLPLALALCCARGLAPATVAPSLTVARVVAAAAQQAGGGGVPMVRRWRGEPRERLPLPPGGHRPPSHPRSPRGPDARTPRAWTCFLFRT